MEKHHYFSRILKFGIAILDFPSNMTRNTYEDNSGQATSVYKDVHLIVFALSSERYTRPTCQCLLPPLIIKSPSSSHACSAREQVERPELGGATASRAARCGLPISTRSGGASRHGIRDREPTDLLPSARWRVRYGAQRARGRGGLHAR
jgi:hypothetical protein